MEMRSIYLQTARNQMPSEALIYMRTKNGGGGGYAGKSTHQTFIMPQQVHMNHFLCIFPPFKFLHLGHKLIIKLHRYNQLD